MKRLICRNNSFYHPHTWSKGQIFVRFFIPLLGTALAFLLLYQSYSGMIRVARKHRATERKREILLYKTTGMEPYVWKPAMQCVYLHRSKFPYEKISECIPVHFEFIPALEKDGGRWKFTENNITLHENIMSHCTVCHSGKEAVKWVFKDKKEDVFFISGGWVFGFFWMIWLVAFVFFIKKRYSVLTKKNSDRLFSRSMLVFSRQMSSDAQRKKRRDLLRPFLFWMEKENTQTGIIDNRDAFFRIIKKAISSEKLDDPEKMDYLLFQKRKVALLLTEEPFDNDIYESCYGVTRLIEKIKPGNWIIDETIFTEFFENLNAIIPINEADIQKNKWLYRNKEHDVRVIKWNKI